MAPKRRVVFTHLAYTTSTWLYYRDVRCEKEYIALQAAYALDFPFSVLSPAMHTPSQNVESGFQRRSEELRLCPQLYVNTGELASQLVSIPTE